MARTAKGGPYHHGHLREALLAAALTLAEERGLQGVTLREVARQAGVSHAAPYHHFTDKAALVEALAVAGFERLTTALRAAVAGAPEDDLARLAATGSAYVRFALEQPAAFRIMFRPELRSGDVAPVDSPAITAAGRVAFEVLRTEVVRGQTAGLLRPDSPEELALTAWSVMHGLSTLIIDGAPGWTISEDSVSAHDPGLAARVATLVIEGLRARPCGTALPYSPD
jgi:AcrR family transcriptional regulator